MNREDLFLAISSMGEPELEQSEEYRNQKASGHFPLRTVLLVAATILTLCGVVFAASKYFLGTTHVEEKLIPISITGDQNRNYNMRICDMYTSDRVPASIQDYYLPVIPEEKWTLKKAQCYITDGNSCFNPYQEVSEDNIPLGAAPTEALWEWETYSGQQVTFAQIAIGALEDEYSLNIQMSDNQKLQVDYRRIMIDEVEVFAFTVDFSAYEEFTEQEYKAAYNWIWSDGNYLYRLSGSPGITPEEMTHLLQSLSPQDPDFLFES